MEEKNIKLFEIPVFSFVPPKYKEIVKERAGKIFGAILICFVILAAITAIRVGFIMTAATKGFIASCPDFSIKGGIFDIEKPYSYDDGDIYLWIDDSVETVSKETVKDLAYNYDYRSILILTRKAIGVCSNGRIEVFNYSDFGDFTFSKDALINKVMPTITTVVVICIMCFSIVQVGLYYLIALIMQLFVMVFASTFKKEIAPEYRFRMAVLAKLPVHVLIFFINLVGFHINMWANLALQVGYIAVVVYFYDHKKEDEPIVESVITEQTNIYNPETYNTEE